MVIEFNEAFLPSDRVGFEAYIETRDLSTKTILIIKDYKLQGLQTLSREISKSFLVFQGMINEEVCPLIII